MRSIYIDTLGSNLKIHDSTNAVDFWAQTPVDGFDAPDYRIISYDKPGEDGMAISSMFYSGRPISIHGVIKGSNPTAFEANRKLLSTACAISRDVNGYPLPKRVSVTTLAGNTFFFDAYFSKPIFAYDQVNWSKYLLQLTAIDPFLYGSQVSSGAIVRASGGGFILPVILPIVSSSATGGTATLVNSGNGNSWPIITLTGPLTNPYINNSTIGKFMQLTYTLPLGSTITIDMAKKSILLNGSSNLISAKTTDSTWWPVVAGNNNITFSTGSSADTGNMQITFYNSYVGI